MQVESSASPLLTEDKASSLPGQFCPFHPRSTLELVEKAQGFCYVYCPEKMCFMFAPALMYSPPQVNRIPPQRTGVTGASPTTKNRLEIYFEFS